MCKYDRVSPVEKTTKVLFKEFVLSVCNCFKVYLRVKFYILSLLARKYTSDKFPVFKNNLVTNKHPGTSDDTSFMTHDSQSYHNRLLARQEVSKVSDPSHRNIRYSYSFNFIPQYSYYYVHKFHVSS